MPYCPKCKVEYQKGNKICSTCGSALAGSSGSEAGETDDREAFLINASDEMEANIFISKLYALGIPVMKKYVELGLPVFMGNSRLGIDLYVPSRLLAEAKNIIKDETISDDEINFDDMLNEYGFDDIDNLDFEDSEEDSVSETPPEIDEAPIEKQEQLKPVNVKEHLPKDTDNNSSLSYKVSLNRTKIIIIIAIVMLIFLIFSSLYSGFQMLGNLLRLR